MWPEDITKAREILMVNLETTKKKKKKVFEAFKVINFEQIKN